MLIRVMAAVLAAILPFASAAKIPPQKVYDACMKVEIKAARAKSLEDPKLAVHYFCKIIAGTCQRQPDSDPCKKALREYDIDLAASGPSELYKAAEAGNTALVRKLLDQGADPNKPLGGPGWTPLMIAVAEGHATTVSALLEAGVDINAKNNLGRTALMFASSYGHTKIAKKLLVHDADPNIVPTNKTGWSALIAAAHAGHRKTVRILLDNGADVTIRDKAGKTALMHAEAQGHSKIVSLLKKVHGND